MTLLASILALLPSAAALLALGLADSKRRRVRGLPPAPLPRHFRTLLTGLVIAPGVALLASGQAAAFLVWLGAATVLGWSIAVALSAKAN